MFKPNGHSRNILRKEFKDKGQMIVRAVQKAKRSYLKEQQVELLTLINTNQNSFFFLEKGVESW